MNSWYTLPSPLLPQSSPAHLMAPILLDAEAPTLVVTLDSSVFLLPYTPCRQILSAQLSNISRVWPLCTTNTATFLAQATTILAWIICTSLLIEPLYPPLPVQQNNSWVFLWKQVGSCHISAQYSTGIPISLGVKSMVLHGLLLLPLLLWPPVFYHPACSLHSGFPVP